MLCCFFGRVGMNWWCLVVCDGVYDVELVVCCECVCCMLCMCDEIVVQCYCVWWMCVVCGECVGYCCVVG